MFEVPVSEVLRESIESLRGLVATLDPSALDGTQAKELVEQSVELERLVGAVRTLAAGRVAETGAWANDGPFRDAGAWMASIAGTTVGRAKATIETAERLASLPATEAALRAGSLSEVQVDAISAAAITRIRRAERTLLASRRDRGCPRVEERVRAGRGGCVDRSGASDTRRRG